MDLYPWQKNMLSGMASGEYKIIAMSRNVGKSTFSAQALSRLFHDIYNGRPIEDLVLSEGRIHGARYYCVEPVGGNWLDMETWAKKIYGEPGEIWPKEDFNWPDKMRWAMNNRKFWSREEKDRDWFIIKWRA